MNNGPVLVEDSNVSDAWLRALKAVLATPKHEIAPLIVVVHADNSGALAESSFVRVSLDRMLKVNGWPPCRSVASSIFPTSLWNPARPRADLFTRYNRLRARLRRVHSPGRYFERLVDYGRGPTALNQLDKILNARKSGVTRRSLLQAGVFDPWQDHTNQRRRGFPCLQQVSFAPIAGGLLAVNGFYATQYISDRAYGNYLGLADLGRFVAHELGIRLGRVTCVAGLALLGKVKVREMRELVCQIDAE
jgi:hypothetical protein